MVLGYRVDARGNTERVEMFPAVVTAKGSGNEVRFEGDKIAKYAHAGGTIELGRGGTATVVMVDREKGYVMARSERNVDSGENGVIWVVDE
jgi:hypothetical protein